MDLLPFRLSKTMLKSETIPIHRVEENVATPQGSPPDIVSFLP